jgi:hypothetical protein
MSLVIPRPEDVGKVLAILVGRRAPVAKVLPAKMPKLPLLKNCYAATLLSDDDQVQGAIIADLAATVYLGGSLMMLPPGALTEQVRTRKVSEEVADAISEVFNNLTGSLNDIPKNPHLRSSSAEIFDLKSEAFAWLASAAQRQDFVCSVPNLGDGQLMFFSK